MNRKITGALVIALMLAFVLSAFAGCAPADGLTDSRDVVLNGKTDCDGEHVTGEWTVEREATIYENGIQNKECVLCSEVVETEEVIVYEDGLYSEYDDLSGVSFPNETYTIEVAETGLIRTVEALIHLPPECMGRGGVIVGNYYLGGEDLLNIEIFHKGQVRLYYKVNGVTRSYIFDEDIRSDKPVHLAVTVDGKKAKLYVDGELSQTISVNVDVPENVTNILVGGDHRTYDRQTFRGKIYSVSLFSDVRSAREISEDLVAVAADTEGLLYSRAFSAAIRDAENEVLGGVELDAATNISVGNLSAAVNTLEAIVELAEGYNGKGGVIIAGGEADGNAVSLEIHENGVPVLCYRVNGTEYTKAFDADVRYGRPVHIALSINGTAASMYINGKLQDTVTLDAAAPAVKGPYTVGNDERDGGAEYFKGKIYGIALMSGVRSSGAIAQDSIMLPDVGGEVLYSAYYKNEVTETITGGTKFNADNRIDVGELSAAPRTFEAIIRVPTTFSDRVGVIVGNYDGKWTDNQINIEVYHDGKPRLYYLSKEGTVWWTFTTDIRSDKPIHLAVSVQSDVARLYVNGIMVEAVSTGVKIPKTTGGFKVGGDARDGNVQYFKGEIYEVNLFSDVRTPEEVRADAKGVSEKADSLIYSKKLYTAEYTESIEDFRPVGQTYNGRGLDATDVVNTSPHTLEAVIMLPTSFTGRGGVIVGNYVGDSTEQINLEVYNEGKLRLFYVSGGVRMSHTFATDVRSDAPIHVALSVDGVEATLYINGVAVESVVLPAPLPEISEGYAFGGDHRRDNEQYFKGTIYSVALFGDARSAEEIASDVVFVSPEAEDLLYSAVFASNICSPTVKSGEHIASDWIVYREESDALCGVEYSICTECGLLLGVRSPVEEPEIPEEPEKTVVDLSGISLNNKTVTYDGTAHSIEIEGVLPEGVTVSYTGNGQTNAGTYTVKAIFAVTSDDYVIEGATELTATLTVNKATVGVDVSATEFVYAFDGNAKSPKAILTPDNTFGGCVSIVMLGGDQVLPGTYKVIYRIVIDESIASNVSAPEDIEVTMVITKNIDGTEGLVYGQNANGTYYVKSYTGTDAIVFIPASYNGAAVTGIAARAFENKTFIKYVCVPDTVTAIGQSAFRGCTSIEAITLPFVGGSAGSSNAYLGFIFGASGYVGNEQWVPASLKTVELSDACTLVPAYSFQGCANIAEIKLGANVAEIGSSAFRGCKSLESIYLPSGVALIRAAANNYNSPFYEISADFVIYMGHGSVPAEYGSKWNVLDASGNRATVKVGMSYTDYLMAIGEEINVPCGNDKIVVDLSGITFGDKTVDYDGTAHSILVSGELPRGVEITYVGNGQINAGTYTVTVKFAVTDDLYVIEGATEMTATLTIKGITVDVTVNGTEFTYVCDGNAKTPDAVTLNTVIDGVSLVVLGGDQILPGTYKVIYRIVVDESIAGSVIAPEDIEVTMVITKNTNGTEGLVYGQNANGTYYVKSYTGTSGVVFIPASYNGAAVTGIAARAFENKTFIKYVCVPDTVTAIGQSAFRGCTSIEAITLPFVGGSAGSSNAYLGFIFGASGYVGNEQWVPASLKTVELSDACTLVPAYSFQGCANITEIKLGANVAEIGSSAFRGCKSLVGIYLPSSVALIRAAANNYNSPFYEISADFVIYMGHESVPEAYGSKWNVLDSLGNKASVKVGMTYQDYLSEVKK